jgi:hypothetical protein
MRVAHARVGGAPERAGASSGRDFKSVAESGAAAGAKTIADTKRAAACAAPAAAVMRG